ncbi:conserved hypothetical protein [Vibrio chagasii]|nr:conserved hypothetical protein [Vibrio chagasii]
MNLNKISSLSMKKKNKPESTGARVDKSNKLTHIKARCNALATLNDIFIKNFPRYKDTGRVGSIRSGVLRIEVASAALLWGLKYDADNVLRAFRAEPKLAGLKSVEFRVNPNIGRADHWKSRTKKRKEKAAKTINMSPDTANLFKKMSDNPHYSESMRSRLSKIASLRDAALAITD